MNVGKGAPWQSQVLWIAAAVCVAAAWTLDDQDGQRGWAVVLSLTASSALVCSGVVDLRGSVRRIRTIYHSRKANGS